MYAVPVPIEAIFKLKDAMAFQDMTNRRKTLVSIQTGFATRALIKSRIPDQCNSQVPQKIVEKMIEMTTKILDQRNSQAPQQVVGRTTEIILFDTSLDCVPDQ